MKTVLVSFFLFIGLLVPNLNGQSQKLGNAEISFEFVSTGVKGTMAGFKTESKIDLDNLENSFFKGSVASETIDTNNGLRNWSLRSGKYFDVDDYPTLLFESNHLVFEGNDLMVKGNLTIKETTKPITVKFVRTGNQLVGSTSLYSIDYGIKIKKKREDNLVKVKMIFDILP